MNTLLDDIFMTMSTSTGMYPKLDLWTANKLQLQLQLHASQVTICSHNTDDVLYSLYLFTFNQGCNF